MNYKVLLILILIFLPGAGAVSAANSRYRVEILVLTHLNHGQEPREVRALTDFSSALDFLQPPAEEAEAEIDVESDADTAPGAARFEPDTAVIGGEETAEAPDDDAVIDPWNIVTHVPEMGPEMQEAARRLRLSAPFRPLQYLSWEQGSTAPFPVLRIHDLESVLTEDPWADQRLALAEETQAAVFGDTVIATGTGDGPEAEPALPDPIVYYRLDGTVSFTRSRFIHLSITAEWREPVFDGAGAFPVPPPPAGQAGGQPAPRPGSFRVHRLEQSRPVRTGRMEYFDGPVLGVLAWVSDISDTVVEVDPESNRQ